jgi:putative tryptophan/tyrosine transport system substrate-binding protein
MRRRDFITLIGGAAAWPLAARAQQAKVPTVGVLVLGSPPPEEFFRALRDGLREVGYTEDRNIKLEIRSAEGKASFLPERAAELVRLKVDVIVAYQTPPAIAAKQATGEIPIVFSSVGDALGTGLVATFARPGGNATGATAGTAEVAGKTVELIRELIPSAQRFAVLANETDPFTKSYLAAIGDSANRIGLAMEAIMARPAQPLEQAFERMGAARTEAVIIQGSLIRKDAADLALRHRLPSLAGPSIWPRLGGLVSYTADFGAMLRETALYVHKILDGAKPADLPVSFPTRFALGVNLKTAKALGLELPPTLLARADEVIE